MLSEIFIFLDVISIGVLSYWIIIHHLEFKRLPKLMVDSSFSTEKISIIIPTRNEAKNVRRCLDSIVKQKGVSSQIIVVDDSSIDETRSIVKQYAEKYGVELLESDSLNSKMGGKSWLCYQGSIRAVNDVMLFLDADTVLMKEDVLKRSIKTLKSQDLDFLSIFPRFDMRSVWTRLIYPLYINTIVLLEPFSKVNREHSKKCFLVGAFALFRKNVYERVGGHMIVVNEILEDKILGEKVREKNYRFKLFNGDDLVATRIEDGIRDLWNATIRFIAGLNHRVIVTIFLLIFYLLVFLIPIASLIFLPSSLKAFALIPITLSIMLNALEMSRNKVNPVFALGYIIAVVILVSILLYIMVCFLKRRLIFRWKGREYIVKF